MGLIVGSNITPVLVSPFGEPRAFDIRGTLVAIRREDCELIEVSLN